MGVMERDASGVIKDTQKVNEGTLPAEVEKPKAKTRERKQKSTEEKILETLLNIQKLQAMTILYSAKVTEADHVYLQRMVNKK